MGARSGILLALVVAGLMVSTGLFAQDTPVSVAPAVAVVAPDAVPLAPFPSPDSLPGGRPGVVFYLAFLLNRALWFLKRFPKLLPEIYHPYLPAIAAGLGLLYGVLESNLTGTPLLSAVLTGLAGSAGAVAWREADRAMSTAKQRRKDRKTPPKDPKNMSDDELTAAVR